MLRAIILAFSLLLSSIVYAAPTITSVNGTVSNGQSIDIGGSSFGTHALQVNSLQAAIEAGTTGQPLAATGWVNYDGGDNDHDPLYATDQYHSGSKSLKCGQYNSYNCGFAFNFASTSSPITAGEKAYLSWWVRYSGQTAGQWKMGRFESTVSVSDSTQQLAFHHWPDGSPTMIIDPAGGLNNTTYGMMSYYPVPNDGWYRMEIELSASTTNTADGAITVRRTSDAGVVSSRTVTGKTTHDTGYSYNYFFWQNYIGSGITDATIWFDDFYVQRGTVARVELCSGATWASRGKCEIQTPTAWGASSISTTVNTGSFAVGSTAYLYVIDSNGDASPASAPITIGESNTPTPIDGVCGSADGGSFSIAPTTNLCSAGTAGSVSGTGPWTWTCDGINGGSSDSCAATLLSSGVTWLTSGGNVITDPSTGNAIGPPD